MKPRNLISLSVLTPWLLKPGDHCSIHKGFPTIPIPSQVSPISRIDIYFFNTYFIMSPHLCLGLSRGIFPVGSPVKMLKALRPSYILARFSANLLDLVTLTTLTKQYKLCSTPYSHPFQAQILASVVNSTFFQIDLTFDFLNYISYFSFDQLLRSYILLTCLFIP